MNIQTQRWWIGLIALLAMVGCGGDIEPFGEGLLEVQWDVAPLGCEASGVDDVAIVLKNERREYDDLVGCDALGTVLDEVAAGNYDLTLEGMDSEGVPRFGATVEDVVIHPDGDEDLGRIELVALPGEADVQWVFDGERTCAANDVDEVEITVYDVGHNEVHRSRAGCEAGSVTVDGLHAGQYLFRIRAESLRFVYEGMAEGELKRGGEVFVEIELTRPDEE